MDEVDRRLNELSEPLRQLLDQEIARRHDLLTQVAATNDRIKRIEKTLASLMPPEEREPRKPTRATPAWVPGPKYLDAAEGVLRDHDGKATSQQIGKALGWNSGKVSTVMSVLREHERVRLAGVGDNNVKIYKLFSAEVI